MWQQKAQHAFFVVHGHQRRVCRACESPQTDSIVLLVFTDDKPLRPMKHIFRLLTKSDLTKDILEKELFILWPDNGQWYAAEIIKVSPDPLSSSSPQKPSTLAA